MNERWFMVGFIVFLIIALMVALYPLRKQKIAVISLLPLLIIIITFAYWHWGSFADWRNYLQDISRQQQVQALLQTIHGPQELIEKLQARLSDKPESARGWYLLGRLYASQQQWQHAHDAFAKAHQFLPNDEQITVNYAQSIWQLNKNKFDDTSRALFKTVLQKNENQPDALAMLAMDAFVSHDYPQAISYWQRLLKLAPPDSEDAKALRKAITKAQQRSLPS